MIDNSVRTFGMDAEEAGNMFASSRPSSLWASVTFYLTTANVPKRLEVMLGPQIDAILRIVRNANIPGIHHVEFGIQKMNEVMRNLLTRRQRAWLVDGVYVQVAFRIPGVTHDQLFEDALALSMTIYDIFVDISGELDPGEHGVLQIVVEDPTVDQQAVLDNMEEAAQYLRDCVGNYFRDGTGVYTEDLVGPRNEFAIKFRALLTGADPDVEYVKFVRSRAKYFLDSVSETDSGE